MNIEELAIEHQKTADRAARNEGRIKKLEEESNVLHNLATSVAVMAEQMKNMNTSVSTLTHDVEELKEKPAKRWENIVEKVILVVATAVVSYLLGKAGIM